ncbi:MAG: YDG domain-containing protein, partial [Treponema sp.]|nr:YDG domain-containing protein [Treponema sp.]
MKKIHWISGIVLIAFIAACSNPFWPDIGSDTADPQIPVITIHPDFSQPLDGAIYYFLNAQTVYDLEVTAEVDDGGHLAYQWYSYPADDHEDVTEIDGETNAAYKPPVNVISETFYYVEVTNTLNGKTTAPVQSRHVKVKVIDEDDIDPTWLYIVDITIDAPVKGEEPDMYPIVIGEPNILVDSVVWSSSSGIIEDLYYTFAPDSVYTVEITLEAINGYVFAPVHYLTFPTINNIVIDTDDLEETNDQSKLTMVFTFDATDPGDVSITDWEITGPTLRTYTHGDKLNLEGLRITISYDDGSTEDLELDDFGLNVITNPINEATLSHTEHNGKPVKVTFNGETKDTLNLTVNRAPIAAAEITVTAPEIGAAPNPLATGTGNFSIGDAIWDTTDATFFANNSYTVSVTLTANADYTFTGGLSTRTINGHTATISDNEGATVKLTYTFTTGAKTVSSITIKNPPATMTYYHGQPLSLAGLEVTLIYNDTSTSDVAFAAFGANNITTIPANSDALSRSQNGSVIEVKFTGANPASVNTGALTVNQAMPTLTFPTASDITYGAALSTSSLTGGSGTGGGSFGWVNGSTIPIVENIGYLVAFTPNDTSNYSYNLVDGWNSTTLKVERTVDIEVNPAIPTVTFPTASPITYGAHLSESTLIGGSGSGGGGFVWVNGPTTTPIVANSGYSVEFTPLDLVNYNYNSADVEGWSDGKVVRTVAITVNPASITSVSAGVTPPANGEAPNTNTAAIVPGGAHYTAGTVSWDTTDPVFLGGKDYTATVTLTAATNYIFGVITSASINDEPADNFTVINDGLNVVLSHKFTTPTRTVVSIRVIGEPSVFTYTHGDTINLTNIRIEAIYDDITEEYPVGGSVTTVPSSGSVLSHISHNGNPIVVTYGGKTANTRNLIVNKKTLTITGAQHTKPYDGNANATGVSNVVFSGIIGTEDVSAGSVSAVYTSENAGTTTINISAPLPLIGTHSGNYEVTLPANNVPVTGGGITKINPVITWPTEATATYGQLLSNVVHNAANTTLGSFSWTAAGNPSVGIVGSHTFEMRFTPTDAVNYNTLTHNVTVIVSKANPVIVSWPSGLTATYGQTLATISLSSGNNTTPGSFRWTEAGTTPVGNVGSQTHEVTFTPNDTANFNNATHDVTITVSIANPVIVSWPSGMTATYGQNLSQVTLIGFNNTTPGTFAWVSPGSTSVGDVGNRQHSVRFTPNDQTNFNIVTQNVYINVTRAAGGGVNGLNLSATDNTITISATSITGITDQTIIEYVLSESSTEPTEGWHVLGTSPSFSHTVETLKSGTEYHVFARVRQSDNYFAGAISSASIMTQTSLTSITITFTPNEDVKLAVAPGDIVISRGGNTQRTLTLEGATYTS